MKASAIYVNKAFIHRKINICATWLPNGSTEVGF